MTGAMRPLAPTITAHLYAGLHEHLMELLRGLTPADWQSATACREWTVRDIAAHILDTQTRTLSFGRDGLRPPTGPAEPQDYTRLVAFLNELNADWVRVMRRVSPAVIDQPLAHLLVTAVLPHWQIRAADDESGCTSWPCSSCRSLSILPRGCSS